jgi:hypothetical protein
VSGNSVIPGLMLRGILVLRILGLLPKSLFALSKAFFDKSKACSRCFQNSPFGLKQLKALIFHFAKIYFQKSALMTAQRDLGNSPFLRDADDISRGKTGYR